MKKGVIFITSGRDDYFSQTIAAWSQVRNLNKFDFYFRLEPSDNNDKIIEIIKNFCSSNNVKENISINEEVNGMSKNHHNALYQMFNENGYDFVVLAEDDIVPSKDIIDYFDYLSNENEENILAVCANNHNGRNSTYNILNQESYFKIPNFNAWIWGTWKNKWEKYMFNKIVCCMKPKCEHLVWKTHPPAWECPVDAATYLDEFTRIGSMYCITPEASRSQHIGKTGYHYDEAYFPNSQVPFFEDYQWEDMFFISS